MTTRIKADDVKAEVQRFWKVFCTKSADELADFYSHEAIVFSSMSERPEFGRVASIRRKREYFHSGATIHAQLGPIDVLVLPSAAVACYTFSFKASNVASEFSGRNSESITSGRATQVFVLDELNKPRILHEHFSEPAR